MVIGTGASAAQFVPEIAEPAAHLTILQRTPAWFLPTPDYRDDVEPEVAWLLQNVPGYTNWLRFWNFWQNVEGLMVAARVDPEWDNGGASVSQVNELIRQLFAQHLQAELADRPDLLPVGHARLPAVLEAVHPRRRRLGAHHHARRRRPRHEPDRRDHARGRAHRGRRAARGRRPHLRHRLHRVRLPHADAHRRAATAWSCTTGGRATPARYLGITLPGYPNLFLLYGPNTNIVVNGSITYFSECEVHHVVGCIEALLREGAKALEPTQAAHDAFNEEVDAENLHMAWGVSSVNTWYKNATGRTAQNWPFSLREYWQRTRGPDLDDFTLHR